MRRTYLYIVSLVLSLAPALPAIAGGYIGAGVGQSSADIDAPFTTSKDETGNALKAFAGFDFNDYLGAEIGLSHLGYFDARQSFTDGTSIYRGAIDIRARAAYLAARAHMKLGDVVEVFAAAGVQRWSLKVDAAYDVYSASTGAFVRRVNINEEDSGTSPYLGVGLAVEVVKSLLLRFEWERYQGVGNDSLGESDVDVVSAGVALRF